MARLSGKRALVTGAASGIGRATAEIFFQEGAELWLADIQQDALEELVSSLGPRARACITDVGSADEVESAIGEMTSVLGGIDVLVNDAGISEKGAFLDVAGDDWDRIMRVNVQGAYWAARAAALHMAAGGGGAIVNVSSISGTGGGPRQSVYGISKGSLLGLTEQLARELGPLGIRVNAVLPGAIETPMLARALHREGDENRTGLNAWLQEAVPMRRCGRPEEVAAAILFLASDDASWVTGYGLPVEGGVLCL